MVAVGETILEPGLRPAVPRCRVTATYPQGGNGMPTGAVPMVNNLFQGMPLDPATGRYFKMALTFSVANGATVQVPWKLVFTRTCKHLPCCGGKTSPTIKFKQYASFGSIAETKYPAPQVGGG